MRRRSHHVTNLRQSLPALLFVVVAGFVGTKVLGVSLAASYSSNPTAIADYCTLENNHTVLYGWAYDPESTSPDQSYVTIKVGSGTWTVPSSVAGYRDPQINSWLDTYYPGAPKPGTYGWRLEIGDIYKGGSYPVSGTALNIGAGMATAMQVNSSFTFAGEGGPQKTLFTSDSRVPDGCLPAAPAPAPTPTPAPAKTPTPAPTRKSTTPAPTPTPTPAPVTPAPVLSTDGTATITPGTTSAVLVVQAGNAAKVHIVYGKPSQKPTTTTDQPVAGDAIKISLGNLDAASEYRYTVVRTDASGNSTTSPSSRFVTAGFIVAVKFSDANKQPVSGIKGTISDSKKTSATSDKNGAMTFKSLGNGKYTITYTYKNSRYSKTVDTASNSTPQFDKDGEPVVITITESVDVSKLTAAKTAPKHTNWLPILLILLMLTLVAWAVWFWRRRKQQQLATEYGALSSFGTTPPAPHVPATPTVPVTPQPTASASPLPVHAGESLRDMVILSMHDQAQHQQPAVDPQTTVPAPSAALPPQQPHPQPPPQEVHHATEHKEPEHKPSHHKSSVHHGKDGERVLVIDHRKPIS